MHLQQLQSNGHPLADVFNLHSPLSLSPFAGAQVFLD